MNKEIKYIMNKFKNTIWKYYLFSFLGAFVFFSAVLIPFFTDWGHLTFTQITILQSWFMLWIFILEVPTGAVADYLGRKYSMALGSIVITLGALIYGSIPKFEIFLLGEFLFATSIALMSGADKALLYDVLKEEGKEEESSKIFGRAHSFHLAGILVAAPIGSFLASKFGLNAPMLLSSIPFIISAIVALSIKEPKIHQEISESRRYLDIVKNGFNYFRNHKTLRLLALDTILVASAAYYVIWLYQPLLKSIGIPLFYFGFIHAFIVLIEILIASNFNFFEKLFKSKKAFIRFSALATGIGFIFTAIFPNIYSAILFIILAGGFGLTRIELMSAYMNKFIPSDQRATILSSISMFRRFSLVLINPIVGLIVDRSLSLGLFIVGLLPLLVFLFSPIEKEMLEGKVKEII